jgi:hypothetical protein
MRENARGHACAEAPARAGKGRSAGPIPIWESRLYRERRARGLATKIRQGRVKRLEDTTLLREKRRLADHLLHVCEKAQLALQLRGGDIGCDLQQIDDLGVIVSLMDSEMHAGTGRERLEELRDYLEAMVLAIEVARVADTLDHDDPIE